MNVAIIPARGGSKRIPRKNIRPFGGRPMIVHSIDAARRSELFDEILVSTEDSEIASLAIAHGASVPCLRPAALADDHTPTIPVIRHTLDVCERLGRRPRQVCCIYACTPLLAPDDLRRAFDLLVAFPDSFVFPIVRFPSAVQRALRLRARQSVEPIWPENSHLRSQDLEPAFYDAGQFYVATASTWRSQDDIHAAGKAVEVSAWRAVDIDTEEDWERAERLWRLQEAANNA
jgi:pseudaminic acid cytidylyltransferase